MTDVKRRTFVWNFDSPVEAIWPVLADTARFNEAAKVPKHHIDEIAQADGSVRYMARAQKGPFKLEWEDKPVNWVANRWFRHCRYFQSGPLKFLCASLEFFPDDGGCRGEYTIETEAANLIGRLILGTRFFPATESNFGRLDDDAREFGAGRAEREFEVDPPTLAAGAIERARELVSQIEATPYGHGLAQRLADTVTSRQEVDVWTIRPLKLARLWDVPERHAIEVYLQATKQGLLGLRWDLLCPRCQIGKESALALDQLPTGAHCPSCNIDYDRNYTENIELAFHPSRSIRPIDGREYCLFGPMSTPHVKLQLTVPPGESRREDVDLLHGEYRLRTLEPGDETIVEWRDGGFPGVVAEGETIRAGAGAPSGTVVLENRSRRNLTFIVEENVWKRDALTAHRATTMQAFRDLFDEDVLRPGDDVEIDCVSIMFTDLKGSTALYERIGDSQAYHLVREHFAVLGAAVRDNNGTVVKTVGDAIMGAFTNPVDAFNCAVQIHADFAAFNATSGKEEVTIKVGVHVGRCISVTLNNRLDYYGTAANKAARLEGQSLGGDIVMSREFAQDAAVRPLLAGYSPVHDAVPMKGFDEPVPYLRITAEELTDKRQEAEKSPASR